MLESNDGKQKDSRRPIYSLKTLPKLSIILTISKWKFLAPVDSCNSDMRNGELFGRPTASHYSTWFSWNRSLRVGVARPLAGIGEKCRREFQLIDVHYMYGNARRFWWSSLGLQRPMNALHYCRYSSKVQRVRNLNTIISDEGGGAHRAKPKLLYSRL